MAIITSTRYPAVPSCTCCGNTFADGAFRVQVPVAGQPKRAMTVAWVCAGCRHQF